MQTPKGDKRQEKELLSELFGEEGGWCLGESKLLWLEVADLLFEYRAKARPAGDRVAMQGLKGRLGELHQRLLGKSGDPNADKAWCG